MEVEREEDYKLVTAYLNGDSSSFEALVFKYEKLVFNIAYKMMRNKEDAEDISQVVFVKVFKKIDTYEKGQSFKAWIGTITTNSCIDEIRKRKNKQTFSLDSKIEGEDGEFSSEVEAPTLTPLQEVLNKEKRQLILDSIGELNEEARELIVLRDINDLSYEEIADNLGLKLGTVKSKISRSRRKLQEIITDKMQLLEN
ncbi:MAG: RNA polymerase sigma factor [Lachnospirales bacterium]